MNKTKSFFSVITEAVNDIIENGFDSAARVDNWLLKIRQAAYTSFIPEQVLERSIANNMKNIYEKMIVRGQILQHHPGISRFDLDMVKPRLRNELDRHIMANANLIKLNREAAVQRTVQRFAGWSTSIPKGGTDVASRNEVKKSIHKALASLPFEERRVAIDQGHKFIASLNRVLAIDKGAIAAIWHSRWRQPGYNYREDHKERDEKVYAIRDNWAINEGYMKVGFDGYTDEITQAGEEPFCGCSYQYIYTLTSLPDRMLTNKGKASLERALVS
jgi:hypothetical protein